MSDKIRAPWTPEQVAALNDYQRSGVMHPFTCGHEHPAHPNAILTAAPDGWRCHVLGCDYEQDWAHEFMANPAKWPRFPFGERHGPTPQEAASALRGVPQASGGELAGRDGDSGAQAAMGDPELTAEEARALVDELGLELYRAQDALAFVDECCAIADREGRAITTADVREWLKGARCGRQIIAEQSPRTTVNNPPTSGDTASDQLRQRIVDSLADYPVACWTPANLAGRAMGAIGGELDRSEKAARESAAQLARVREAVASFDGRGVIAPGHVNFDVPTVGEVLDKVREALDPAATQATEPQEQP